MARPALTLAVDLSQQDSVYYLPLGAKSNDDEERIKLAVRLWITHDDPDHDELTISAISFSFPGTDIQKIDMDMVPEKNMTPEDGKLRRGDTAPAHDGPIARRSTAMRTSAIACALLAGSLGLGSATSAGGMPTLRWMSLAFAATAFASSWLMYASFP